MITPEQYSLHVERPFQQVTVKPDGLFLRICVISKDSERELLLQQACGELTVPMPVLDSHALQRERELGTAGLQVLALEGGGRGPIINEGETITLALLKELLSATITRNELHADLLAELARIPLLRPNTKEQNGYASHNETVSLNHNWLEYPPNIEMQPAPGTQMYVKHTHVGIEPDCITYVEIPQQELIYGHSGIVNQQEFTVKAAILEKAAPIVRTLDWTPASITGPPLIGVTTESPAITTSVACMGLRIRGGMTLQNGNAYAVTGALFVQMQIDSAPWVNLAVLHYNFKENLQSTVSEAFDTILVFDQTAHTYKFRGRLVVESDENSGRLLSGSLSVNTVTEFGSGTILSHDPLIQWASKEKL